MAARRRLRSRHHWQSRSGPDASAHWNRLRRCHISIGAENSESDMAVELNHTIIWARDSKASAAFLAEMLGLPAPSHWGPFEVVATAHGTNLDYLDRDGEIASQHYAFLVSEAEFDAIFGRIKDRGLSYWADPGQTKRGEINRHDGGRGLYFADPNGHLFEIITRP